MSFLKQLNERLEELSNELNYDVRTNIYESMYRNYNMFVRELGYKQNVYVLAFVMYTIRTSDENLEKIEEILKMSNISDRWIISRADLQYKRTLDTLRRYNNDELPFKSYRLIYRVLKMAIEIQYNGFTSKTVKKLRNDMFNVLSTVNSQYMIEFGNMLMSEAKDENELREIKAQIMGIKLNK